MDVARTQRILTSLMIISFLIFGLLTAIIFVTDAPLDASTTSLPFAFLFISGMTLVITGQINERPKNLDKYLKQWLVICVFVTVLSALAFTIA